METNNIIIPSESSDRIKQIYSSTDIHVTKFSFTWEIKNVKNLHLPTGECLSSSEFQAGSTDQNYWRLWCYPNGYDENDKDYFCLAVYKSKGETVEKNINIVFILLNRNGKENIEHKILINNITDTKQQRTIKQFVKKEFVFDENNGFLVNNTIILKCELCFSKILTTSYSLPTKNITKKNLPKSIFDFEHILESNKFSDVKLIVGDREFSAHKNILAACSPVFAAMFDHEMKEQKDSTIEITDINDKVIKEVLNFMYTGKVNNIETLKKDLLIAADKYQINALKALCEEELINSLNIDTFEEMLKIVDRYPTDSLKIVVIEFFTANAKNLVNVESYKKTLQSLSPSILEEILSKTATFKI